jgi:dipeptidyl aminopeptidase/acylaminoacyl peptidase
LSAFGWELDMLRHVEYKLYAGEQHGFRKAETIIDAHERELAFYVQLFYPELAQAKKK